VRYVFNTFNLAFQPSFFIFEVPYLICR